ncbi:MAG TPA: helix-turn-helix transcriptional regulator [Candidatus Aenigmarchaeota archaeon]|nr:helix-turn-helix transcriptional regulator [Candidatus Aenigmarchaeota archaeon]
MKEFYRIHAEMCKVFSNPTRLEILHLLRYDELSVTELIDKSKLSQANISQHLAIMKARGIVVSRRDGKNIYYRLANPKIVRAFDIIRDALVEKMKKDSKAVADFR